MQRVVVRQAGDLVRWTTFTEPTEVVMEGDALRAFGDAMVDATEVLGEPGDEIPCDE